MNDHSAVSAARRLRPFNWRFSRPLGQLRPLTIFPGGYAPLTFLAIEFVLFTSFTKLPNFRIAYCYTLYISDCYILVLFHFISFHFISFHFISFHFISFHFMNPSSSHTLGFSLYISWIIKIVSWNIVTDIIKESKIVIKDCYKTVTL